LRGWGGEEGGRVGGKGGVGERGEMTQILYAHMNKNKIKHHVVHNKYISFYL
jgi:hypothetical protein